mmetsp:Transcript_11363/g.20536  ORF Transcript_11363/g.20536 Transcript_11363/m.20536 type:complete len:229 (+) Transcript_11363:928-1614(+)
MKTSLYSTKSGAIDVVSVDCFDHNSVFACAIKSLHQKLKQIQQIFHQYLHTHGPISNNDVNLHTDISIPSTKSTAHSSPTRYFHHHCCFCVDCDSVCCQNQFQESFSCFCWREHWILFQSLDKFQELMLDSLRECQTACLMSLLIHENLRLNHVFDQVQSAFGTTIPIQGSWKTQELVRLDSQCIPLDSEYNMPKKPRNRALLEPKWMLQYSQTSLESTLLLQTPFPP